MATTHATNEPRRAGRRTLTQPLAGCLPCTESPVTSETPSVKVRQRHTKARRLWGRPCALSSCGDARVRASGRLTFGYLLESAPREQHHEAVRRQSLRADRV